MQKDYIHPYVETSQRILRETTNLCVEVGNIHTKTSPFELHDFTVLIGMIGQISGQTTFSFSGDLACKLTSAMMGGYEVKELDEIVRSAMSEMGNMIMGHTSKAFSDCGIVCDITTPSILECGNLTYSVEEMEIICIPLIFEDGNIMEINISFVFQQSMH